MSAQLKPAAVLLPAKTVAVAEGDGIGPEITRAVLKILTEADPGLAFQPLTVGLQAYLAGHSAGFDRRVTDAVTEHGVLLKGPITTPQGGGYKSVNVSLRKTFGLSPSQWRARARGRQVRRFHEALDSGPAGSGMIGPIDSPHFFRRT